MCQTNVEESKPKILTEETVPDYLTKHASDINIFPKEAKLTAKAIVGGNVNYAFCVEDDSNKDNYVFVKQAPNFVAIFGPGAVPLTSERMQRERDCYMEWRRVLGEEMSQKYLPTLYKFDDKWMVLVMEFLKDFTLLDHDLVSPNLAVVPTSISIGLGEFMATTHAATHSTTIAQNEMDAFVQKYENREMRDIQLEYVFSKCYKEATEEQKAGIEFDDSFLKEVDYLKTAYNGKANKDNLALCHGDLHPGSVMVNFQTGEVKVIDQEFTVYGPPGLDVGSLLSGYVLAAVHQVYSDNPDAVVSICDGAEAVWNSYKVIMEEKGFKTREIEIDTVGFAVAEVCRTALEFAGGRKWLQFEDPQIKAKARKSALNIVQNCMVHRHEGGMELLLSQMKSISS